MAKPRGLAALAERNVKKVRRIARSGGIASGESPDHYRLTSARASEIGKEGGKTTSASREFMAKIGREGGKKSRRGKKAGSAASRQI